MEGREIPVSSEERMRERLFNQVYGDRTSEPLKINIVSQETSANKEVPIYVLVHNKEGSVSAVGFADMQRSFTFAFSTLELAESFVSPARKQKLLLQVDRILPMTVGEYFDRKNQGWTNSDLCIDPHSDMLIHPNVKLGIQNSN